MSKNIILSSLLILVLILIVYFIFFKITPLNTIKINIGNTKYNIEVAKSMAQKQKGLSDRQKLCSDCGMIFTFGNEGTQPFWMKDTLIGLDIIWLKSDGEIVSIQTAQPEIGVPMTQLKIYQNTLPAKYVIELNAGDATKLNLKVGDHIKLNNLNE